MVRLASSSPPVTLTFTPSSPPPSVLTLPRMPAVRRYVPSKLTTFTSPTPSVNPLLVDGNRISSVSKPDVSISMV
ncbi:MAG: hypothetical protein F4X15_03590 [Gemmatimonadetes bacterium]|nr:hypothetical protein [Gemmatimonadota bacterium]MYC90531.1 hypothetical protein [Gemmatimonadota bacterium]